MDSCLLIVPIFSDLAAPELDELSSIASEKRYAKGESIYRAGSRDKRLYVIHTGRVKIYRLAASGKARILRVLGPGDFMGELSILNDSPLADYAEATEDSSMCIIEGTRLKALMHKSPVLALKLLEAMSQRLDRAESLVQDMSLHSAEARLAQALVEAADGRREFELAVSKGDFASQLGMSQETLSRRLSAFQERGFIELKGLRGIVVLDPAGLGGLE